MRQLLTGAGMEGIFNGNIYPDTKKFEYDLMTRKKR